MRKARQLARKVNKRLFETDLTEQLTGDELSLVRSVRGKRLTYLSENRLAKILTECRRLDSEQVSGLFLEAGCALGGSAIMIATVKQPERHLQVFDVFDMIPAPTVEDGRDVHKRYGKIKNGESAGLGGDTYYGYQENLYEKVHQSFADNGVPAASNNVSLIRGLVQETLELDQPVAFAHIDVDWYEPVKHCLEQIAPNLSPGGVIVLDDYFDWSGCQKATDEFLKNKPEMFTRDRSVGSLVLTRVGT